MANEHVRVELRRTYGYQGRYYGPGKAVRVPAGLASALGLTREPKAKKKPRERAAESASRADTA